MPATMEPLPQQIGRGIPGKGMTAAATSLLAAAFPPAAFAVVGASAAMQAFGDKLNAQQQESLASLVGSAQGECGLTAENVIMRLAEDEDLCLLAAEAFDAARRSRIRTKAASLGKCLGNMLNDSDLIEVESVWLRILARIEPPHLNVLRQFLMPPGTQITQDGKWGAYRSTSIHQIGIDTGLREVAVLLVEDLLRAGLLHNSDRWDPSLEQRPEYGTSVSATVLGSQLFDRLEIAAGA